LGTSTFGAPRRTPQPTTAFRIQQKAGLITFISLPFYWISGFAPGREPTQNRMHILETLVNQRLRRTGA
jgi:hypothetical protein